MSQKLSIDNIHQKKNSAQITDVAKYKTSDTKKEALMCHYCKNAPFLKEKKEAWPNALVKSFVKIHIDIGFFRLKLSRLSF